MKPHEPCRGTGCPDCCDLGHAPICKVCLGPAGVWCMSTIDVAHPYSWLCLDCYRASWHEGEIYQGQVLVRPMMAHELARLLDKVTAA
jgi:hypothetical protein